MSKHIIVSNVSDAPFALGVAYAHSQNFIHRDLKPSNILITNSGRPKVIDFGVALMAGSDDPDHSLTKQGRFVGTLQWSSPEQCGDDPHDVDVRTDVYSLGMVLYHLMTNTLPYDLKGVAVYKAPQVIQDTVPASLQSLDNTIPIEIEHIVQKALKKERTDRYESVAELSLDIRRFLNDQPIHAKHIQIPLLCKAFLDNLRALFAALLTRGALPGELRRGAGRGQRRRQLIL